ncbi:hypothetical protein [Roseivirga sp. UBA1976]|uniref:hypothetical protein n=1 Tax=Roseivirga sp. UBA1976 TaxID=1947386 RepID=UPI00257AA7D5|nr:hypothetical protein [Roseivirga sp. UBA1976]MEC7752802.1 hypothetical protein [Bacteroidota bacterium]
MKIVVWLFLLMNSIWQQTDSKNQILKDWIATQNQGSDKAINTFIDRWFSEELKAGITDRSKHVAFYRQIIDEFGEIQETVYEVMESTPTKLKVQLLKKNTPFLPEPSPENILVVEIDVQKNHPNRLARGLGMGALICYIKRD